MSYKSSAGLAGRRGAPRARLSCAVGALVAAAALTPATGVTFATAQAQQAQGQPPAAAATPLPTIPVQTKKPKPKIRHHPVVRRHVPAAPVVVPPPQEAQAEPAAPAQGGDRGLAMPASGTTVQGEAVAEQRAGTSDTASLLRSTPGVSVYTGGGVSNLPVIRGLNDDRVNTTINGMAITAACGNHMNPPLSYADPAVVRHIDVMAGVSPVSAGGDSLGSVIAVETATPEFAGPGQDLVTHARISAFVRSVNEGVGGSVGASVASGNVAVSYTGAWTKGDNYVDGHGDEVGSTMYEAWNHALTLAMRGRSDLLVVDAGIQKIPYQGFVNQYMDMTDNEAWFVNARYEKKFEWGKLYAQAFYQHTAHEMDFLEDKQIRYSTSGMYAMPMLTEGQNMGYKLKAEIPLTATDMLRVGSELHHTTLDDWWPPIPKRKRNPDGTYTYWWPGPGENKGIMCCDTFWNINGGERTRLGTFVEVESKWSRAWTTLVGLRNDLVWMDTGNVQGYNDSHVGFFPYGVDADAFNARNHAKLDVNFDVTALARYEPTPTSTYEFGYARKTRSPTFYERYTWSRHPMAASMLGWFGDGNGYVGNLDLNPEIGHTASFTAAWRDRTRKDWEIKVTPYATYVEDYIGVEKYRDNCPVMGNPCPFLPTGDGRNADLRFINHDALLYGVDISGSKMLWESPDYGRFALTGAIGYVHGENADTGDPLYHIMPWNARFALQHKWGHWTNAVELELVADKDEVDPVRKELRTSGYALVNLRSSYEWQHIRLDFGVENVFDQYYEPPLGGLNIGVSSWSFPVDNVPGQGRNFFAGVTMKF